MPRSQNHIFKGGSFHPPPGPSEGALPFGPGVLVSFFCGGALIAFLFLRLSYFTRSCWRRNPGRLRPLIKRAGRYFAASGFTTGTLAGGAISSGSEEDLGSGALANKVSFPRSASSASRINTEILGKEESDPSNRWVTPRTLKATTPRFAP